MWSILHIGRVKNIVIRVDGMHRLVGRMSLLPSQLILLFFCQILTDHSGEDSFFHLFGTRRLLFLLSHRFANVLRFHLAWLLRENVTDSCCAVQILGEVDTIHNNVLARRYNKIKYFI